MSLYTGQCVCLWVLGVMSEGGTSPSGWVYLREIVFDVYMCVCGELGKASVRWAALMCRNAEIPQWLCGSAVSLRQPPPPPSETPTGPWE